MQNDFYFILTALSVLKMFKGFVITFGHVGKTAWLERQGELQNLRRHNLVTNNYNTYIAQHMSKATRQLHLAN